MSEQEKPFDHDRGHSGQAYHRDDEQAMGRAEPSGSVTMTPPATGDGNADTELPSDNGKRASVDPKTGEVHGSGAGAVVAIAATRSVKWTPRLRRAWGRGR